MSIQSSGIGGRAAGSLQEYQIPLPPTSSEILAVVGAELSTPGTHSVLIAEGRPITVSRYVDVDDVLNEGHQGGSSPQELLSTVNTLVEYPVESFDPKGVLMDMLLTLQKMKLQCCGIIVGRKESFFSWLGADLQLALASSPPDNNCDFVLLGIRGYQDHSLDTNRVVLLGGTSAVLTKATLKVGLAGRMETEHDSTIRSDQENDGVSSSNRDR